MHKGTIQLGRTFLLAQLAVVLASVCYTAGNLIVWCLHMVASAKLACISLTIAAFFMEPATIMNNASHPASWQIETW